MKNKNILAITTLVFLAVGCTNQNTAPAPATQTTQSTQSTTQQQPQIQTQEVPTALIVPADAKSIEIKSGAKVIRTIKISEIPPFDINDAGNPSNPTTDYAFSISSAAKENSFYDSKRNQIYFVIYNTSSAGNANADQALFTYDLNTSKISLIDSRDFSVSFGTYKISPGGNYMVFSDGVHGGLCADLLGLTVLDLNNNKELAKIFLPNENTNGYVEFNNWTGNSTFTYKQSIWKNQDDCQNGKTPASVIKTYTINSK